VKNLHKIIGLFIFIFLTGIFITVRSINTTLYKKTPEKTVQTHKDTLILSTTKKISV